MTSYDKNGNIQALQRYGNGLIDNLTYTYSGNQLTKVEDATGNTAGFNNGASAANEYVYDNNGNLTKDSNKGITNIAYNSLSLPSTVTFSDGSTIVYSYAADGTKLRTVHTISGTTTQKDYCANVVYENGVQKMLLTEEGYVDLSVTTPAYYYYLKDHQGNNRVVLSSGGTAVEVNHYYPFGSLFASTSVQPYKYNGKELDTKKGLNWYDYGARHYDATLGRWFAVDPLAEKHHSKSPYVYCLDNPMLYIDPLGKDTVLVQDINVRPYDRGIKGETYTAKIEVIQNGEIVGTYRGSSYPNSVSNSNNSTKWNTVKEGEYDYNNQYGHSGGTQKGLNIVNEKSKRVVSGVDSEGKDVEMINVNVHSGTSDNGNYNSRGSKGCITVHPEDVNDFFSHF